MSSENANVPNADPNNKVSPPYSLTLAFDDALNNNTMSYPEEENEGGVGDVLDLISEETPPSAILELASDPDLPSCVTDAAISKQGEGTEMTTISTAPASETEKVISSRKHDETASASRAENKMTRESYDLTKPLDLLSPKITAASHNQNKWNEKNPKVDKSKEGANFIEEILLKLSDTQVETIDTSASSPEREVNESSFHIEQHDDKSRAVNAPEAEGPLLYEEYEDYCEDDAAISEQPRDDNIYSSSNRESFTLPESFSLTHKEYHKKVRIDDNIAIASNNDAGKQQQRVQQPMKNVSPGAQKRRNDDVASTDLIRPLSPTRKLVEGLPTTSLVVKEKSPNDGGQGRNERGRNRNSSRSPSLLVRRKQSYVISRNRSASKSPARVAVVEVHQRKNPIGIKTTKGKYPSPYQCKIFPVQDPPGKTTQPPFPVDPKTHRMLDNELTRILDREKYRLMEAVTDYYYQSEKAQCSAEDSLVSPGSTRETFMSWIVKEKNKDLDGQEIAYWNPMANIFRKTRSTQVSGQPSFSDTESHQTETAKVSQEVTAADESTLDNKIHLIGPEKENDIRVAAQNMYQSLKLLQKVIHLSDLFCFRDNLPEMASQEEAASTPFGLPEFHQFMESGNEIEILENVMRLLGTSKENILQYLSSLQGANLITGKGSGLTKITDSCSSHNNNSSLTPISTLQAPTCTQHMHVNGTVEDIYIEVSEGEEKSEQITSLDSNQIIPLTCPSCHSQIDVEVNTFPRNQILPKVHTFLEEQWKLTMCTYYNTQAPKRTLIQTVMCDGLRYKIQFTTTDPCGPIQGILQAETEYLGQPSPLSIDVLLSTIHRCTSYIDTRIACSCVWGRQSKHYLYAVIEKYLNKDYRPSTQMNRWNFSKMEKKLKKINVFSGVIQNVCNDLVDAVSKIQFCMQKSMILLDRKLKDPALPGFVPNLSSTCVVRWDEMNTILDAERSNGCVRPCEDDMDKTKSVELLYRTLKSRLYSESGVAVGAQPNFNKENDEDADISVEALMKIAALAVKEITAMCDLGEEYSATVKMPNKNCRRVLRFINATVAQLGCSKEIQLGTLIATLLSAVEKLSIFEEFMCEQKVEIRANIHKMCLKIIRKLCELRSHLWMQKHWSKKKPGKKFLPQNQRGDSSEKAEQDEKGQNQD